MLESGMKGLGKDVEDSAELFDTFQPLKLRGFPLFAGSTWATLLFRELNLELSMPGKN